MNRRGVSLIEVLMGIIIVVVASIATLSYFSSALGSVGKQGNRRAALERARQRLEQLMETSATPIKPSDIDVEHTVTCAGGACAFSAIPETVSVQSDLPLLPIVSTVQCRHDTSAGTPNGTCDVLELSTKVWFIPGSAADNDFNRVHIRTLRVP